jgi:cell division septation protein DedD
VAELEKGGFGPSTSAVETSSGSATRVWVGPYETRVEAARMKTRVTQQTGSEALIVAYP